MAMISNKDIWNDIYKNLFKLKLKLNCSYFYICYEKKKMFYGRFILA